MPDQRNLDDALVIFSVKDKDFLGMNNQFMGESFFKFSEIPNTEQDIDRLPQVHLPLHRPTNFSKFSTICLRIGCRGFDFLGTDRIKTLENRQGDKLAREFLKKLKQKAP